MENHLQSIPFGFAHLLRRLEGPSSLSREKEAVVFRGQRLSYGDLYDRAGRLADALRRDGVQKGDRIAVLMGNHPAWFDIFFASSALGCILVPVNHLLQAEGIRYILADSGATTLVAGADLSTRVEAALAKIPDCRRYLVVSGNDGIDSAASHQGLDYEAFKAQGDIRFPEVALSPGDPTLLQYTSGTTGFPKGATHTVSSLMWNSFHQPYDFGMQADDRYLCVPTLCWVAGMHDFTLATLWIGGTVILHPTGGLTVADVLAAIERERCTGVLLVPTILKQLVDTLGIDNFDLSSLKFVLTGGEPAPVSVIRRFYELLPTVDFLQAYGLSEGPSLATFLRAEDAMRKVGSCGKPATNCEIRIVDPVDQPLAAGETGEILIRSAATMAGYWNQAQATAETLRGGWLHTGDVGRLDEEGYLTITGRKKDMYISGGLNIYPAEVEAVIINHEAVAECAVFGIPDEKWGEVGMAVVVVKKGATLDAAEVQAMCQAKLARYQQPKVVKIVTEPLIRTASGKMRKFKIRELYYDSDG